MRCSDGKFYVVKFRNNPQHVRILANEMFASALAAHVGLPVPNTAIVEVTEEFITGTPELHVQLVNKTLPCASGLHFGSKYVVNPLEGQVFDYVPTEMLDRIKNLETFAGVLAFDKWTGNVDSRQAAFWRKLRDKKYTIAFIDHGYCFNAGEWTFPDFPLRGVYGRNEVYSGISGWHSFEPWLSRIEEFPEQKIWEIARAIPREWFDNEFCELERLIVNLIARRRNIRTLIEAFGKSPRRPFERWSCAVETG